MNSQQLSAAQTAGTGSASAVFDSLPGHCVLVDQSGHIVAANESWKSFGRNHGAQTERVSAGVDYLAVCDAAHESGAPGAGRFADALRAVLRGERTGFELLMPSLHNELEFLTRGRVTALKGECAGLALIAHEEVHPLNA